jgi:hypothetical protein
MQTASGNAVAAGAITICLIDMLVTKGLLTKEDVGTLLSSSQARLVPFGQTPDIAAARETLTAIAAMYTQRNG